MMAAKAVVDNNRRSVLARDKQLRRARDMLTIATSTAGRFERIARGGGYAARDIRIS
jgi:hypothetical protein